MSHVLCRELSPRSRCSSSRAFSTGTSCLGLKLNLPPLSKDQNSLEIYIIPRLNVVLLFRRLFPFATLMGTVAVVLACLVHSPLKLGLVLHRLKLKHHEGYTHIDIMHLCISNFSLVVTVMNLTCSLLGPRIPALHTHWTTHKASTPSHTSIGRHG
ncbi:hypothetical protein B0H15DRAFT_28778 [Mycena belliarum]|uniref:Uncharacterized protein n=1 Tax=Mycena belliarum TaxID=1033014 RepID=A0AAD6UNH3_9AGAR|nr:hypothetical protein B0H15DRAFT_28778 [Mycena belliae]